MKFIIDEQIPYVKNFFTNLGDLKIIPASQFTSENIKGADVLLVRSVTNVNKTLLAGSSVRFVGSANAGIDHLDTEYLDEHKIAWAYAPGSNAKAVADYVVLSVAHLIDAGIFQKTLLRAGVIGVGNVGQQVVDALEKCGFDVLLNDPLRGESEIDFVSTPMPEFYDLDLICVHTPLTTDGPCPTQYLIDHNFLSKLNSKCVFLNASRGGCVDTNALKQTDLVTVLDVWENEPNVDIDFVESAFIATPHIAGWSQPAKYRATHQLYDAFCNHFEVDHYLSTEKDPSEYIELGLPMPEWTERAFEVGNLQDLSDRFKNTLKKSDNVGEAFKIFRNDYRFRPEFNY